ncbi:MAG: holo-ACP synthase [Erysipelotrichaceae bacterium]
MISGTGVDIVSIERIRNLNYERLATRILTPTEYQSFATLDENEARILFLAGRFAAKEAVYKAISHVYSGVFYRIEILKNSAGQPYAKWEDHHIHLSISHEYTHVVAFAIWEQ